MLKMPETGVGWLKNASARKYARFDASLDKVHTHCTMHRELFTESLQNRDLKNGILNT